MALPVLAAGYLAGVLLGPIVYRVFFMLGIGIISYAGFDLLIDQMSSLVRSYLFEMPDTAIQMFGILRIDQCITMQLSAYAVRFTVRAGRSFIGVR